MSKNPVTRILITAKDEASGVFTSLKNHAGKIAATIAAYFSLRSFADAARSAEELDLQMRKLEGVITATGGAAGLTAQDIDEMARRLDEATLGSAAGFRDAAAQLLTFKSVGKDSFETVLELAQDLASNGFGTLEGNAVQLGKALEDPVKGLTALTRSGVTFTAEQQRLIKALVESGQQAKAQGLIIEAVAGQVGGVARQMGSGLSGAVDLVKKRLTDLREQVGKAVLPVFQRFNERLAALYQRLADSGAIKRFGETVASVFGAAQEAFFRFIDSIDLDALIAKMREWGHVTRETVGEWTANLNAASRIAQTAFGVISTGFNTVLAVLYKVGEAFSGVTSNILTGIGAILQGMSKITFGQLSAGFAQAAETVKFHAGAMWSVSEAFADKAAQSFDAATAAATRTGAAFAELVNPATTVAESVERLNAATEATAEQATLTSEQLDALGNDFEFVDGAARKGAAGMAVAGAAASKSAENLFEAERAALDLDQAYKDLGITSQAALQQAAESARTAFERIRDSGTATARDVENAFRAYAERAIAANNGVVEATLKAEAAQVGLKVEADETGRVVVRSMREAAQATEGLGNSAEAAAAKFGAIGAAAEEAAGRVKGATADAGGSAGGSGGGGTFRRMDMGQEAILSRAERLGGLELRKQIDAEWRRTAQMFSGMSSGKGISDYFKMMGDTIDRLDKLQIEQERASGKFAANEPRVASTTPAGAVRVEIGINGGRATGINTASQADAQALVALLQQLERDAARSS